MISRRLLARSPDFSGALCGDEVACCVRWTDLPLRPLVVYRCAGNVSSNRRGLFCAMQRTVCILRSIFCTGFEHPCFLPLVHVTPPRWCSSAGQFSSVRWLAKEGERRVSRPSKSAPRARVWDGGQGAWIIRCRRLNLDLLQD